MAVAESETPDFTTLADFVSGMRDEIRSIFEKVVLICHEAGLIGGETFAMDGCKIRSSASKEWTGTIQELTRKREKAKRVVKDLMQKHRNADSAEERQKLQRRMERSNRLVEKLTEYLENSEPQMGRQGREKRGNITDPESASMFSSRGVVQGYNGVALVDAKRQIILATEAFGINQEHPALIPLMEQAERLRKSRKRPLWPGRKVRFLADTGYFSEENLQYLAEKRFDDYIPDINFRKRDPRFNERMVEPKKGEKFFRTDFRYEERRNCYICPAGKKLSQKGGIVKYRNGRAKLYQSRQAECTSCKIRWACISERVKRKQIWLPLHGKKNYSERMRSKIDTPEGRAVYTERMHIVEPVFGNITFHKKLNYFTLRGKAKVNIQWLLYAIVHNIEKFSRYAVSSG